MDHHQNQSRSCFLVSLILTLLIASSIQANAQTLIENPTAKVPTTWVNNFTNTLRNMDFMRLQPILARGGSSDRPWFSCGFYCNLKSECTFAILLFPNSSMAKQSKVVWSANRNNPVSAQATLVLSQDGLDFRDANGTSVWSTNTTGKSVSSLNLTETGNLVLVDRNDTVVWQSFDYPTDSLLPGQSLFSGQSLRSNISSTKWGEVEYSLSLRNGKLVAYIEKDPAQLYYESSADLEIPTDKTGRAYVRLGERNFGGANISGLTIQFMKLEVDGHVKVYGWSGLDWLPISDWLTQFIGDCGYPMVCGTYGICSAGEQCTCPSEDKDGTSHFRQIMERQPDQGCTLSIPIVCSYSQFHSFVELNNVSHSSASSSSSIGETDAASCKSYCLMSCACKAALFQHNPTNFSSGNCLLLPEVFSFQDSGPDNSTTAYVKVQNPPKKKKPIALAVAVSVGVFLGAYFTITNILFHIFKKQKEKSMEVGELYFDELPGRPSRFSYEYLREMTYNFGKKLGEGGFGSVFEGSLPNGIKIAVKLLDKVELAEKTFLAEVETIGNIHHINLVRLIGFCIEKSHRLLVYEYMSHGSLDKWIFSQNRMASLRWNSRRKIILEIAKGLAYLHEGCRQKIFHLDIKPQNILLDENFNVKLADFGLSKLIDKDQSKVMTTIKGTPGYMAPEWLSSFITEKVDVYSFGVVVLEVLCGRRNLDSSQPEEDMHLLSLFKTKAEAERLSDMVDKYSEDMQSHEAEVVETMKVAAWCLQNDFAKRPSMTVVVQVLEGIVDIKDTLDYNFTKPPVRGITPGMDHQKENNGSSTLLFPSVLSGPR